MVMKPKLFFLFALALFLGAEAHAQVGSNPPTASPTWMQLSTSGGPPPQRKFESTVYDPVSNRLILFAGCAAGTCQNGEPTLNDVWVLTNADGSTVPSSWIQINPTPGPPPPRHSHVGVYDSGTNTMIIWSGDSSFLSAPNLSDVWILTNANGLDQTTGQPATSQWNQLFPTGVPPTHQSYPGREISAGVYDPVSNRMIIFGGAACGPCIALNDVWALTNANGSGGTPNWIQLLPTGGPPSPRIEHTVVYDVSTDRMILFGGGYPAVLNDTWVLINASGVDRTTGTSVTPQWTQLATLGGPPPARGFHAAAYDATTNQMIIFGGSSGFGIGAAGPTPFNDVWVLTNANGTGSQTPTWGQVSPAGTLPPNRVVFGHRGLFNPSSATMLVYGGASDLSPTATTFQDSWVLTNGPPPAPVVSLSTTSLNFPNQTVNTTSNAMSLMVTNTGTAALNITQTPTITGTNMGDFTLQFNAPTMTTCVSGTSVPPQGSCLIYVTFTPSIVGPESATLDINDNALNSPQMVALSGTGTAAPPPPSAGAVSLSCPPQSIVGCLSLYLGSEAVVTSTPAPPPSTYPSQGIIVTNTGTGPLNVFAVSMARVNFGETHTSCVSASPLPPGATCTISVTLQPQVAGGVSEVLGVISDAPQQSPTVFLSGYGITPAYQFKCKSDPSVPCNYDNGMCDTNSFGCALTSSAVMLTAFDPNTTTTTLDTFLAGFQGIHCDGYSACNLEFRAIPDLFALNPQGIQLQLVDNRGAGQSPPPVIPAQAVDCYLQNHIYGVQPQGCQGTGVPLISPQQQVILQLCEADLISAAPQCLLTKQQGVFAPLMHFVVVLGQMINGDWAVFDPGYLNQWRLQDHLNGFGAHKFFVVGFRTFASSKDPSSTSIQMCSPVEALVTDPMGRRLGDLQSGTDVYEVPSSSYYRDFPLEDDQGTGNSTGDPTGLKAAYIPWPVSGSYTIVAKGSSFGPYTLTVKSVTSDGKSQEMSMQGFAAPGSSASYSYDYSSTPGQALVVIQQPSGPQLGLSANSALFANQIVGTASGAQTMGVADTGTSPLVVSSILVTGPASGDFSISTSSTCPAAGGTIAMATSCVINVVFTPTAQGMRTAMLTITDNAPGSPHLISLSGTGLNSPPFANTGTDQTVECMGPKGTPVTLNGSGSGDPDGDSLTFLWTDSQGRIVGNSAIVSTMAQMGMQTYTLTVTDPAGLSAMAQTHVTVRDTTPPVLTLTKSTIKVVLPTATATGALVNLSGIASATDICDPNPTITNDAPANSFFPIGATTVTFTASDHSGNSSQKKLTVQVVYAFSGYLVPVLNDGSAVFNSGRTVPVKFQLTASDGTFVTNAVANLQVFQVLNTPTGTVDMTVDTVASGSSNTGTFFRFDPTSNQYIYNLSTLGFLSGTYLLRTTLNDGTTHDVQISIR